MIEKTPNIGNCGSFEIRAIEFGAYGYSELLTGPDSSIGPNDGIF
jgi:hypothetical protein